MLSLFLLCLTVAALLQGARSQYFVDPGVKLVDYFEGWGTSMAWWPDVLGDMPEDVIQRVTEDFFSVRGLHMNIVRYTIGGTTPGQYNCGSFRPGGATESYKDGPNMPYNWTRDARQRRILAIAKDLGADTFEAFSNSPPQWMTVTGCSKGNAGGGKLHANFDSANATQFAVYIADVLEHFKKEWGMEFQYYVPFNEPYGLHGSGWWVGPNGNQEGCHMGLATMTEVIKAFHDVFMSRNISTALSVSDENQVDTAINVQNYFRASNVTQLSRKVNVHGYSDYAGARRDILYSNTMKDGHVLWMDEMGWSGTPVTDMAQGLNVATRIVKDLRDLLPSAWVYWQTMEDVGGWGLLEIPYNNASLANIVYNSGFYSFMQFTKYIRKGSSIIYVSEPNTIAAHDPNTNRLVLITVNPSNDTQTMPVFSLGIFSSLGSMFARRTTSHQQFQDVTSEIYYYNSPGYQALSFDTPPESITTVVIENATMANQLSLITDGDFEGSPTAWRFDGNAGISGEFTWLGSFSGHVVDGSISQTMTTQDNGYLFLSARCASAGGNTVLMLLVDGVGVRVNVTERQYMSYGLSWYASGGATVEIRFEATSESYIDNVSLTLVPDRDRKVRQRVG